MILRIASGVDDFMRNPLGAGVLVETSFVWCATPTLGGSTCWGAPSGDQTRRVMRVFDAIAHPSLGPQLDVLLDGYRIETVDAAAVLVMLDWTRRNLDLLRRRIRRQVGVAPPSIGALMLAGILPMLGETYSNRVVPTPEDAYRVLLGDEGDALRQQIAAEVAGASATSAVSGALRALLRAQSGNLTLADAARELRMSPRSLQRELISVESSFRKEQIQARLSAAQELLLSTDDKLSAIAAQLGVSEQGLNRLIRERLGVTPEEWRRALRTT